MSIDVSKESAALIHKLEDRGNTFLPYLPGYKASRPPGLTHTLSDITDTLSATMYNTCLNVNKQHILYPTVSLRVSYNYPNNQRFFPHSINRFAVLET
jgi:hypothetical protein